MLALAAIAAMVQSRTLVLPMKCAPAALKRRTVSASDFAEGARVYSRDGGQASERPPLMMLGRLP